MKTLIAALSLVLGLLVLLIAPTSLAQSEGMASVSEKQETKKRSGWTLQEWLNMKERNNLMDQWLVMNTSAPTLYEFFVGYEPSSSLDHEGKGQPHQEKVNALAYASLVGLSGSHLTDGSGWDGGLRLRLLGSSDQKTNFTLEYGLRNRDFQGEELQNQTASALLTLNLTQVFGLTGSYKFLFEEKSDLGDTLGGQVIKGGIFLDFAAFRLQGVWYQERLNFNGSTSTDSGIFGSLGFYF